MNTLTIENISVEAEGNSILEDCSLKVNEGDCIALLGPNGHGKSTLLNAIMGSPRYKVTKGKISLNGEDILPLDASERSKKGIFMAFQNPPDVPGVVTMDFYRAAMNAHEEKPISLLRFYTAINKAYDEVGLDSSMASRHLNEGYSGGEKKRNEILQMLLLKPKIALLDEIDSGLDVDALNEIGNLIKKLHEEGTTFLIVSHYDKLYDMVEVNRTAVVVNGRIAKESDGQLAKRISREGYSFLEKEYGIKLEKKEKKPSDVSIGVCAVRQPLPPQGK